MKKHTTLKMTRIAGLLSLTIASGAGWCDEISNGRTVGYSLAVNQADRIIANHTKPMTWNELQAKAELEKKGLGSSWRFSTASILDGYGMAIVSIEQPKGTLETDFGKEAELVFSIQPCTEITTSMQANGVRCMQENPRPALTQTFRMKLAGGETATARFPHEVTMSISVIDQSQ